jgi:hypothetical protein
MALDLNAALAGCANSFHRDEWLNSWQSTQQRLCQSKHGFH